MDQSNELRELTRKIERNLENLNESRMCQESITLAQCHALVEIGRMQATSLKDLAQRLTLDPSTMSKTVENLVNTGLITRDTLPDNRRMVVIRLTAEGLQVFNNIENDMDLKFEKICGRIVKEDLQTVLRALEIYNNALEG